MLKDSSFQLTYMGEEQHLMLPTNKTILLAGELYDILFQYLIFKDREDDLKRFIALLETHIKNKPSGPFSYPVEDLKFIDEGLQELSLLNWQEIPVQVYRLDFNFDTNDNDNNYDYDLKRDEVFITLNKIFIYNQKVGTNIIYVYPNNIIY